MAARRTTRNRAMAGNETQKYMANTEKNVDILNALTQSICQFEINGRTNLFSYDTKSDTLHHLNAPTHTHCEQPYIVYFWQDKNSLLILLQIIAIFPSTSIYIFSFSPSNSFAFQFWLCQVILLLLNLATGFFLTLSSSNAIDLQNSKYFSVFCRVFYFSFLPVFLVHFDEFESRWCCMSLERVERSVGKKFKERKFCIANTIQWCQTDDKISNRCCQLKLYKSRWRRQAIEQTDRKKNWEI